MAPWMSGSDALVIWMFSTAMKAPMMEPMTASQTFEVGLRLVGDGDVGCHGWSPSRCAMRAGWRRSRVDRGFDRHARAQPARECAVVVQQQIFTGMR